MLSTLIQVWEHVIQKEKNKLEATVKKPSEAEKFRLETIAAARKLKTVLEAEAASEALVLDGEARAYAIEIKAKAEAEQMAKKADAWNEYEKAAMVDMMLKVYF
jgi:flotillin